MRPGFVSLRRFLTWALVGSLMAFIAATLPSIGLLVLPVGLIALVQVVRKLSVRGEAVGFALGVGMSLVGLGLLNLGSPSCPPEPQFLPPGQHATPACGGPSPIPLVTVGSALALVSLVVWRELSRRQRRNVVTPVGEDSPGPNEGG